MKLALTTIALQHVRGREFMCRRKEFCGGGGSPRTNSGWVTHVTGQHQDFTGATDGLRGRKANGTLRTEFPGTRLGGDAKLTTRNRSLKLTGPWSRAVTGPTRNSRGYLRHLAGARGWARPETARGIQDSHAVRGPEGPGRRVRTPPRHDCINANTNGLVCARDFLHGRTY